MAGGRPIEYSSEILIKAQEYVDSCQDTRQVIADTVIQTVKLPSIEGLARYLKIHRSTVYEWRKAYLEFSDIIEDLLTKQAETLINNGLAGNYNSSITKVILTKHGYTDKQEIDQKTEHSGGITIKFEEPDLQHPEDKGGNGELPSI